MRRDGGGNEPDFVEMQGLAAALGQEQVAVVDRIERTAVEAETHRGDSQEGLNRRPTGPVVNYSREDRSTDSRCKY